MFYHIFLQIIRTYIYICMHMYIYVCILIVDLWAGSLESLESLERSSNLCSFGCRAWRPSSFSFPRRPRSAWALDAEDIWRSVKMSAICEDLWRSVKICEDLWEVAVAQSFHQFQQSLCESFNHNWCAVHWNTHSIYSIYSIILDLLFLLFGFSEAMWRRWPRNTATSSLSTCASSTTAVSWRIGTLWSATTPRQLQLDDMVWPWDPNMFPDWHFWNQN